MGHPDEHRILAFRYFSCFCVNRFVSYSMKVDRNSKQIVLSSETVTPLLRGWLRRLRRRETVPMVRGKILHCRQYFKNGFDVDVSYLATKSERDQLPVKRNC
jgi:hypothetical protein